MRKLLICHLFFFFCGDYLFSLRLYAHTVNPTLYGEYQNGVKIKGMRNCSRRHNSFNKLTFLSKYSIVRLSSTFGDGQAKKFLNLELVVVIQMILQYFMFWF